MKLIPLTVALLGASQAVTLEAHSSMQALAKEGDVTVNQEDDSHLAQLVTQALAGAPPGEITLPKENVLTDHENDTQMSKGKTINYEYFWKYACAFTKWIPTNQFLHASQNGGEQFNKDTMTLERFGFIGTNKKCFWGMVGVKWVTPLKVEQIKPKTK